jgi:hypothetical protein
MDYAALRRVQQLLTALTDAKSSSLDEEKLSELKGLLRQSDALVEYTAPLLLERLACDHSQVSQQPLSKDTKSCWVTPMYMCSSYEIIQPNKCVTQQTGHVLAVRHQLCCRAMQQPQLHVEAWRLSPHKHTTPRQKHPSKTLISCMTS